MNLLVENADIIIPMLAAHLLGDFIFQTEKIVKNKKKFGYFLTHISILVVLSYILLGAWNYWQIPVAIFITHALIDIVKTKNNNNGYVSFIIDQVAHLAVIIILSYYFSGRYEATDNIFVQLLGNYYFYFLILTSAIILTTKVSGISVGMIIKPYQEKINTNNEQNIKTIDIGAGKIIGYLERLMILVLILSGQNFGVGFLITAKSILRFSEIKNARDRAEVEYVLIGTLLSFLFGISIAVITMLALNTL